MKLSWNRAKGLAMLVVVLIAWGIGYIVKLPPALSDELRGTYVEDLPAGRSFTYLSVDDRDFHIWNEKAELFLYGTYEMVGEKQYVMEGKHIPKTEVNFEDQKLTILGIDFVKHSDSTMTVNGSLEKAKANDEKTAEELGLSVGE